ncbi:MAG: tRNA 2-thiouridine(34) synthase MnmA [Gallionellaceae bacterium]|nr:tRNA 2-thiouridine(34) synthase MnmA [Gallionellaceae bacterium]
MTNEQARFPLPNPLDGTTSHSTRLPKTAAKSLVIPQAGEGANVKKNLQSRQVVVVGMSGGVDSAVAALLLKEQGYEVIGLFMKNWEDDDNDEYCSSRQDLIDAVSVADVIGIPIEAVNFSKEYKERVFSYFLREYQAGRTPNPDILCNSEIKFKAFLEHAISLGADLMATGHYAQVREVDGHYQLLKASDDSKDQSYFLHRLNQAQLSKTLFPLGTLLKSKIREIARQYGLSNHAKKDSTGICFIGERPFREFLNRYLPNQPGEMRTPEGQIVGQHIGLSFYTIGQRQGLGIGGAKDSSGEPWFVAGKDMVKNYLIVVQGHDHPALLTHHLDATDLHWISGVAPNLTHSYAAKTRYRQADAACTMTSLSHGNGNFEFTRAQWAVTPGQSVVVYDGEICLGGGIITGN